MLEKLKEISKNFLAIGVVLYLFGFISITSFLARFGIISFDIINSRFIVAGFFSLIAIAFSLLISWQLYKNVPLRKIFSEENWTGRIHGYFAYFFMIYTVSLGLSIFYSWGKYSAPYKEEMLIFKSFGKYDFFGNTISRIPIHMGVGYDFIIKSSLYIFSYVILIILLALITFFINDFFFKNGTDSQAINKGSELIEKVETKKPDIKKYKYFHFLIITIESFILCFFLGIAIYSYLKVRVNLFDFNSFSREISLDSNLIFTWFYVTTIFTYIFLNAFLYRSKLSLSLFNDLESFSTLNSLQATFQYLIIPIIGSLILFGQIIFPRIPFAIGGGEPRIVKINMQHELPAKENSKLFLIGESNQFFFVVSSDPKEPRAFQINKDEVYFIQTK